MSGGILHHVIRWNVVFFQRSDKKLRTIQVPTFQFSQ